MTLLDADLQSAGFKNFEDFWALPHDWVDAVNFRYGGWSATSHLRLGGGAKSRNYFIKRQQNQLKQCLTHPFGQMTFKTELASILRNHKLNLPTVEVAGFGIKKQPGRHQAILITKAIASPCLSTIGNSNPSWHTLLPLLRDLGNLLLQMHTQRISHGALYPHHLFIDVHKRKFNLIDFERSRRCTTARDAVERDLNQFLRRASWMPTIAISALFASHLEKFPQLTGQLIANHTGH